MTQDHTETLRTLCQANGLDEVLCALSRLAAEQAFPRPAGTQAAPPALPHSLRNAEPCDKLGHIVGLPLSGRLVARNLQTGIGLMECGGNTIQIHLEWFEEHVPAKEKSEKTTTSARKPKSNWLADLIAEKGK